MPRKIFISLPVTDIAKSRAFYAVLGWQLIEKFSGADSACFAASDTIYFMLSTHEKFQAISPRARCPQSGSAD